MAAMFNQQYDGVGGKENLQKLHTEYVDKSGIGQTAQFELLKKIHNTQIRKAKIDGLIELEKKWFVGFDEPFFPAFEDFKKMNHRLKWDPERPTDFIEQLQLVETKEKINISLLDNYFKELESLKKNGVQINGDSRKAFIQKMITLGKYGFKIERNKTDMEELAYMVNEYDEDMRGREMEAEAAKGPK